MTFIFITLFQTSKLVSSIKGPGVIVLNFHCGSRPEIPAMLANTSTSVQLYYFVYKLGPRIFTCYIQMLIDSLPASFHYLKTTFWPNSSWTSATINFPPCAANILAVSVPIPEAHLLLKLLFLQDVFQYSLIISHLTF